jgi:hypothetical protein
MNLNWHRNVRTTHTIRHRLHATLSPVPEPVVAPAAAAGRSAGGDAGVHPPEGEAKPIKTFKDDAPGFVHVDVKDLPQMPDAAAHQYLFVAIERAPAGSIWKSDRRKPQPTPNIRRSQINALICIE